MAESVPPQILNHVIFLGAGASFTSGYPIGQELRLRIASKSHFQAELQKNAPAETMSPLLRQAGADCRSRLDDFKESVELFRHGGFATVDEFSKLASDGHQEHVQNMKKLMRIALSIHNPEERFHESDYYPFVQKLFREDELAELRSNITILTYNYDCYLDFLLLEAFRHRQMLSDSPQELNDFWCAKLTSGFFDPKVETGWAEQTQGFNYFKLHGSIAYGNDRHFGHDSSFRQDTAQRLGYLGNKSLQFEVPPVAFPWELFDGDSGKFISENDFVSVRESKDSAAKENARRLFRHFKSIWENAKRTVLRANKISFVGLSMHKYMHNGLAYLFEGKTNGVQAVVANRSNEKFRDEKNRLHPASLPGQVADIFRKIAPKMKHVRSTSEDDNIFYDESPESDPTPDITARTSFADFIEKEMS